MCSPLPTRENNNETFNALSVEVTKSIYLNKTKDDSAAKIKKDHIGLEGLEAIEQSSISLGLLKPMDKTNDEPSENKQVV